MSRNTTIAGLDFLPILRLQFCIINQIRGLSTIFKKNLRSCLSGRIFEAREILRNLIGYFRRLGVKNNDFRLKIKNLDWCINLMQILYSFSATPHFRGWSRYQIWWYWQWWWEIYSVLSTIVWYLCGWAKGLNN